HSEHIEHPNENPNNFERVTHDVVNDNRNGVHVNKIEHVSVSGNNVVGKATGRIVQGSNGAVSNGRNNVIVVGPNSGNNNHMDKKAFDIFKNGLPGKYFIPF
ncbi:hypothetical protein J3B02_005112, partial [Coemansia erecta]